MRVALLRERLAPRAGAARRRGLLPGDRRAVAALETALVSSVLLVPLLSGLAGSGEALRVQQRLDRGLHAALMHGWATPATDVAGLQSAAQDGYGTDAPVLNATATIVCYCITLGTGARAATASSCGTQCSNGQVQGKYANMSVTATFTPAITIPWGVGTWNMSANGMARIQ